MKVILSILLALTVIFLTLLLAYQLKPTLINKFIRNTNIASNTPETSPLISTQEATKPAIILSESQTENAIKTNINSKNFEGLVPYMKTGDISITYMSSECCQPQNPTDAIKHLSYIEPGIPLDFNQNSELIKNLKVKNPQLLDAYIGISKTTEHLAAFNIDNNNTISAIQLAVTWKLYTF